jgi:hypothetical protein
MMLSAYIQILIGKLDDVGDIEVAMTQNGYYADGPLANLWSDPHVEKITLHKYTDAEETKTYLVLGNSYQSY